jgi:hypothetical protein
MEENIPEAFNAKNDLVIREQLRKYYYDIVYKYN